MGDKLNISIISNVLLSGINFGFAWVTNIADTMNIILGVIGTGFSIYLGYKAQQHNRIVKEATARKTNAEAEQIELENATYKLKLDGGE